MSTDSKFHPELNKLQRQLYQFLTSPYYGFAIPVIKKMNSKFIYELLQIDYRVLDAINKIYGGKDPRPSIDEIDQVLKLIEIEEVIEGVHSS